MKKLNIMLSFVLLSFCLLVNVSFAEIVANTDYDYDLRVALKYTGVDSYSKIGYNETQLSAFISSFLTDGDTTLLDIMSTNNHSTYYYYTSSSSGSSYFFFYPNTYDVGACLENNSVKYLLLSPISQGEVFYITFVNGVADFFYSAKSDLPSTKYTFAQLFDGTGEYPNLSGTWGSSNQIKEMSYTSSVIYRWDGVSYYNPLPDEPEIPTMPTNAEIAQAVQLFNDNVFDEEKTGQICGFSDFFVLYDKSTKKYTYIGHGMGNSLGQLIVAPDYHYEGYKFDKQWWKFFKDTESNDYNIIRDFTKYFVYTSEGTLETLTYIGASNISGLIDKSGPWATDTTIIVYSTIDYPVKNVTFDSSTSETIVETGTIEGDQYTYDENLDITDNNYNPLDNFVTVDPIDTVIGNVNFSEINKTFEENKGILNIENASWLFTANNKLISYFIGFLSLLIVFLIISRALGG